MARKFSKILAADGSTIIFSKKEIDVDIESVIFDEVRVSPKIVKEKFELDCKFERYINNWCSSKWKLALLRELNKKFVGSK